MLYVTPLAWRTMLPMNIYYYNNDKQCFFYIGSDRIIDIEPNRTIIPCCINYLVQFLIFLSIHSQILFVIHI